MSNPPISSTPLPKPIKWEGKVNKAAELHIEELDLVFEQDPQNSLNYVGALAEVTAERFIAVRNDSAAYWLPYLHQKKTLKSFFRKWLTYTPAPANPGLYIEYWDYLVNTDSGILLANNPYFKPWFRQFLNHHGQWINSTSSTGTIDDWMKYKGTQAHPFNINTYDVPKGGFKSFNQFFLRNLKPNKRPLCKAGPCNDVIVAPCDGGVFYLDRGDAYSDAKNIADNRYPLPGKSGDHLNLQEAIPGYGRVFQGGPILDILLWFTDYHHFHAPVSGTVIHQGLYQGAYNYDFDDYDANDHYAPTLPSDSDRVGWYKKLGKHQRYVWVIRTEELGLVAMIAIGFWGVGSIINAIKTGDCIEKGQYMGHFGYGGSSIVLAFEPMLDLQFKVGDKGVQGPDFPVLMKVRQCLGKLMKPLEW